MGRRLVALGLGVVAACGADHATGALDAGPVGASIAVVDGGSTVVVVDPDQGSVSFLDAASLGVKATVSVGGEPHALLPMASGAILVANYRGGEVVAVDAATHAVTARKSVCAGAYGLAASPDGTWVAVSCEWDGRVMKLDAATLAPGTVASGLRRPRAVAVVGSDVWVADYVGGLVHDVHADGTVATTSLVPTSASYRPALTHMSANLTSAVSTAFGALRFAHVLENNTGDTTEAIAADYGSVTDTNPKINPAVTAMGGIEPRIYAKFDGGPRVYSGPVALAAFGSQYLLVAHVSTANVAVLDTRSTDPGARSVGTYQVGAGPAGIAVDEEHHVAFVDNALDQSVSRIDLSQTFGADAPVFKPARTLVRNLPSPYSAQALAGRRFFFDATNPHVTPAGVVACASCHPSGNDDGLVWFENTPNVPFRHRRTPHLANAKTATAPFHWDGQFTAMDALVESTMTNIMGGDGLLVDTTVVQPFIDEIVQAPVLPPEDPGAVARGQALFTSEQVGCSTCHTGSYLTDDMMHVVLSPESLDPGDAITQTNTPGLHGAFLFGPYFHDGRAATLNDVLADPIMGHTKGLSAGQIDDLIAYVRSL
ncbi:MAG TPA: cytochrome D1 domain-containing protein [Polyangiaceae bacterium]|nr:cytochrome D1 domain-containing protein [Polyangiaceae bacterium]